jgi:hypothetical protein
MAEETTAGLGEALGLQTSATPYSGSPIFRGLQTGLQYEMKREALKAKEAAEEEKKRLAFEKSVTSPTYPRVGKRWQKSLESIGKETLYGMYDAASKGDREMQQEFRMKGQILGNSIAAQNDYENKIRNSKALLPKTVSQSLDSDDDTGITQTDYKWHDYIEPVDMGMIGGNQRYSFNLLEEVQPMDIRKENATVINDMLSDKPLTETGASLRNYFGAKKELNKEDLKKLSTILVGQNLQYRNNLLVKFEDEGKKILQNYINKGLQYDEAKERALEDLAFNKIKEVYEPKYEVKPLPKAKDKWSTTANQMFSKVNPQAAIGDVNFVKAVVRSTTGRTLSDDAANSVISKAGYNPEYQSVSLPEKIEVTLEDERGNPVKMVVSQLIDVDNFEDPEYNGVYVVGTSSMIGGGDAQFKIGNIAFNKIVKLSSNNIGSLASANKIDTKELVSVINEKTKREFIPPSIIEGTIVQKRSGGKSTSTGGGKGKGKGNNIPSTNVSSR